MSKVVSLEAYRHRSSLVVNRTTGVVTGQLDRISSALDRINKLLAELKTLAATDRRNSDDGLT